MGHEHKAWFCTFTVCSPRTREHMFTNMIFYDTVAQNGANMRTCSLEHANICSSNMLRANMPKCCNSWPGKCPRERGMKATWDFLFWILYLSKVSSKGRAPRKCRGSAAPPRFCTLIYMFTIQLWTEHSTWKLLSREH